MKNRHNFITMNYNQRKNALDYEYKSLYSYGRPLIDDIPSNRKVFEEMLQDVTQADLAKEEDHLKRVVKDRQERLKKQL